MFFKTGLFIHIIGIFLIAGGSVGTIITESLFWKNIRQGSDKAKGIAPLLVRFPPVIIAGALLMLVSGLMMLYSVHWAFWEQGWFKIKLLFFVLLILNGRLFGSPAFEAIVREVQLAEPSAAKLTRLKNKARRFHIIQFTMFTVLVALVIFNM